MKEKPIIFTAPMVRAILEGRKTQTRRLNNLNDVNENPDAWDTNRITVGNLDYMVKKYAKGKYGATFISLPNAIEKGRIHVCPQICPYTIGQRVWVRENWRIGAWDESRPAFALDYCDGPRKEWVDVPDPGCDDGELFNRLWQQSTDDANNAGVFADDDGVFRWEPGQSPCRWRPSIFMPRWASRINLEITGVRVEKLQDISGDDCWKEGIENAGWDCEKYGSVTHCYRDLWQSLHGQDSWDKNPWVWVIEFKRVEDK